MVLISRIWLATLNRIEPDAGVEWGDTVNLTVNIDGEDVVTHDFLIKDKTGSGLISRGFADIIEPFESSLLTNSSIRLGMRRGDAWGPLNVLVLGTTKPSEGPSQVLPLALELDQTIWLSTDPSDSPGQHVSMPVRLIHSGSSSTVINRVLVLFYTGSGSDVETNDKISIEIRAGGNVVATKKIPDTTQDDLEQQSANWYFLETLAPFTLNDLLSNGGIKMSIDGDDAWIPSMVFLYGFDTAVGRPTEIVKLVSIPEWTLGPLSTDQNEDPREGTVDLPLN
jgi:hypothetical protein